MENPKWLQQLFESIDQKDADTFATFLADDAVFKFGNGDQVNGKAAIRDAVEAFLSSIQVINHKIIDIWSYSDAIICHGYVTYTRHDSNKLTVPFANIFKTYDDLIKEYLIYVDTSQLYS
ncbi:nuclear transport factor 2 family protein [Bacteroidota bacterium]